jgi:CubicO group peptidase (beta-lactamase class C family)
MMRVAHRLAKHRLARLLMFAALLSFSVRLPVAAAAEEPKNQVQVPVSAGADEFPSAWPEEVGIDSRELIRLSEWIRKENLDVRSLLIVKDGKLVFERYSGGLIRDDNYELYSITKGVTALLAGILINEGRVRLDDRVATVLSKGRPGLRSELADKQNIELRHVLSMSTGLRYDFKPPNDPIYYDAPDRLRLAVDTKPWLRPGAVFEYMDVNPVIAAATLSVGAGMPLEKYAEGKLFQPLGMKNAAWERADKTGLVSSGWGLRLRAVDMAKVGILVLNGGRWNGQQVVPEEWIKQMTSPAVVPYFGYYWWIKNVLEGGVEGGAEPEYDSMGFKGQFIVVLPQRNAVVVMTSMLPIEGGLRDAKNLQLFRYMIVDYIIPALNNKERRALSEETTKDLKAELSAAEQSKGKPGAEADPTDTPRH